MASCGESTQAAAKRNAGKIFWYGLLAKVFGYTFALKLMENGKTQRIRLTRA